MRLDMSLTTDDLVREAVHVIHDEYSPSFDYLDDVEELIDRRGRVTGMLVA